MVLSIESSDGYWIFFNRKGEEISEPMNTEEAIAQIWSIKSARR